MAQRGEWDTKDDMMGATAGVSTALRRLRHEVRWFGWQLVVVGSGFWREAAGCMERFVVDTAAALEQRHLRSHQAEAGHWSTRIMRRVGGRLVRAFRGCEPWVRACRRLAVRLDKTFLAQRDRPASKDEQAGSDQRRGG
jgi:hypothetical protein